MTDSWVLRIAAEHRLCESCWDKIPSGDHYFLMLTGERFCRDCPPPEEADECQL